MHKQNKKQKQTKKPHAKQQCSFTVSIETIGGKIIKN